MKATTKRDPARERRDHVLRIFEDEGWGNLELLDGWDGDELDELKDILDPEEFQTLLDRLRDADGDR